MIEDPVAPTRFSSVAEARQRHFELLERVRARGESDPELGDSIQRFIESGRATGALVDSLESRRTLQSILDYWWVAAYRTGHALPDPVLADFDPSLAPELPDASCPFLGLDAFDEADADRFFGRRAVLDELIAATRNHRLVAVVGPSGSGKSSLVRAGLLPLLRHGAVEQSADWRYYGPVLPGSSPLSSLAQVVAPDAAHLPPDRARAYWSNDKRLAQLVTENDDTPVVLVIDQFEEVFTRGDDSDLPESETRLFLENVLELVRNPRPRHTVIVAIRSDYESYVQRYPELARSFQAGRVEVPPLSADELRQAIEQPANQVGLKFEDRLVDELLREIVGEPAALPLLQFTLLELWRRRDHNRITWEAYRGVACDSTHKRRGVRWALSQAADTMYDALLPEDQETSRRILLQLVRPGDGLEFVSRRVCEGELLRGGGAPDRVERVLVKLMRAGLVRRTPGQDEGEAVIEIAHEALVRNWPRLAEWLDEDRQRMRVRRRLTAATEAWLARGRDAGLLWGGAALAEARSYTDLSSGERAFIGASLQAGQRRARARLAAAAGAGVGVLGLIAALVWGIILQSQLRTQAEESGLVALSRQLAADALERLSTEADTAALLAVAAYNQRPTAEARSSLLQISVQTARLSSFLPTESSGGAAGTVFAPGKTIAAAARDGTLRLWDLASRQGLADRSVSLGITRDLVSFASDGSAVAFGRADGSIAVWSLERGQQVGPPLRIDTGASVTSLALASGGRVAAAGDDGSLTVWSAEDGQPIRLSAPASLSTLAFSPDGSQLAAGGCAVNSARACPAGGVYLWKLDLPLHPWSSLSAGQHHSVVSALAFTADGRQLASASADGVILVREVSSGKIIATPRTAQLQQPTTLAFNSDGTLAWGSADSSIALWDVARNAQVGPLLEPHRRDAGRVNGIAFSSDGRWLSAAYDGGPGALWDLGIRQGAVEPGTPASPRPSAPAPDGVTVATGECTARGTVGRCVAGGITLSDRTAPLLGHKTNVSSVAFSPDGQVLASASSDGAVMLWDIARGEALGPPLTAPQLRVGRLEFSGPGTLRSESADATIVWDFQLGIEGMDAVVGRLCRLANRDLRPEERDRFHISPTTRPCGATAT